MKVRWRLQDAMRLISPDQSQTTALPAPSHARVQFLMAAILVALWVSRGVASAGCLPADVWLVNTRCAAVHCDLAGGIERIRVSRRQADGCWQESSIAELVASDPTVSRVVIYAHGNNYQHPSAIAAGKLFFERLLCGDDGTRCVIWSWPAQKVCRRRLDDLREKASRANAQGFYLAWLMGQFDEQVPIGLAGHSFGTRVVASSLSGLATGVVARQAVPDYQFHPERRVRALLMAAATDNSSLLPGRVHGGAVDAAESLLITKNPRDRILRRYHVVSPTGSPALGNTGLAGMGRLGDQTSKIRHLCVEPWIGPKHWFRDYMASEGVMRHVRGLLLEPAAEEVPIAETALASGTGG